MVSSNKEYLSGNLAGSNQAFSGEVNGDLIFGVPGTTFFPQVSETGMISWTNDGG